MPSANNSEPKSFTPMPEPQPQPSGAATLAVPKSSTKPLAAKGIRLSPEEEPAVSPGRQPVSPPGHPPKQIPPNAIQNPFVIELFAGSARVTTCLHQVGMPDSFGVDNVRKPNSGKVLISDLTTAAGKDLVWTWIKSPNCVGLFAAPPCGTCSRARNIPIYDANGKRRGPRPLRSNAYPDGLRFMRWLDRLRVTSANILYEFLSDLVLWACANGKIVCIENPRSSLYWQTSFYQRTYFFSPPGMCIWIPEAKVDRFGFKPWSIP